MKCEILNKEIKFWLNLYWTLFRVRPDLTNLKKMRKKTYLDHKFNWTVLCIPEVSIHDIWKKLGEISNDEKHMYSADCTKRDMINTRDCIKKPYIIWVRDNAQVDRETINLKTKEMDDRGLNGITLDEMFRLSIYYWVKSHGNFLDPNHHVTFCIGTRFKDNPSIPVVEGGTSINTFGIGNSDPKYGTREVID